MTIFLVLISFISLVSAGHYFSNKTQSESEDLFRCAVDSDCPIVNCFPVDPNIPCPEYICHDYRCWLISHLTGPECRILNTRYCVDTQNPIRSDENLEKDGLDNHCYNRFGVCSSQNGVCGWEKNWAFRKCLFALNDKLNC